MAPPVLVDFGVSVMGSEVVKKHQKASKSTKKHPARAFLVHSFGEGVLMSSREKAPNSTQLVLFGAF